MLSLIINHGIIFFPPVTVGPSLTQPEYQSPREPHTVVWVSMHLVSLDLEISLEDPFPTGERGAESPLSHSLEKLKIASMF